MSETDPTFRAFVAASWGAMLCALMGDGAITWIALAMIIGMNLDLLERWPRS